MPRLRAPLLVLLLAVPAAAPAGAAAKLPVVAASPSVGTPTTTFRVVVPKRFARRMADGAIVSALYTHRREDRCTSRVLPRTRVGRDGTIRVVLDPAYLELRGERWCTGRYRVLVTSELITDDDDETGEGGSVETRLARSSFVVRR